MFDTCKIRQQSHFSRLIPDNTSALWVFLMYFVIRCKWPVLHQSPIGLVQTQRKAFWLCRLQVISGFHYGQYFSSSLDKHIMKWQWKPLCLQMGFDCQQNWSCFCLSTSMNVQFSPRPYWQVMSCLLHGTSVLYVEKRKVVYLLNWEGTGNFL